MRREKKAITTFLNKKAKSSVVFNNKAVLITDPKKILQEIQNF